MWFRRKGLDYPEWDPDTQEPVMRCSICNGERVAGFQDRATGRFIEAALIRDDADLEAFLSHYGLKDVKRIY